MRCDRARELVGAYVDGELKGDDRASVAAHIESCAVCRELTGDIRRTSKAIAALGREPAPAALASRIYGRLAGAADEEVGKRLVPWRVPSGVWRQAAALAACSALSVLLTWWVMTSMGQADRLEQQILAAHIRSLLQDSPIQVASSDSHTVKPWFAGRVDFAPEVRDLAAEGFPLLGGRLDYVHDRRVGALVYRRRLHIVNVFMWRAGNDDAAPALETKNGYNLLTWTRSGVTYWAVSDLDASELKRLQSLL
ncbi:MAG TPA: anti-sigma factor [Hyphomicrobiaceae bacterium]|nr:anti-sigma factor [Hyphomicrobiaceae bacterium]